MVYQFADHIHSTDSISRYREIATAAELESWGFILMKGRNDVYVNQKCPHISFHAFQDTDNHRGQYRTTTLYRIVDISEGPRKYKEA